MRCQIVKRKVASLYLAASVVACFVLANAARCQVPAVGTHYSVTGRLKSISSNTLVVTQGGKDLIISLTPDIRIRLLPTGMSLKSATPATLTDAVAGSDVRLSGFIASPPVFLTADQMVIRVAIPGPVALEPLPDVPKALEDKLIRGLAALPNHVTSSDLALFSGCRSTPDGPESQDRIALQCASIGGDSMTFIKYDSSLDKGWGAKHGYLEIAHKLMVAAYMRACAFGQAGSCDVYAQSLAESNKLAEARAIWQSTTCWTDGCHESLQKSGAVVFDPPLDPPPFVNAEIVNHFDNRDKKWLQSCLHMPSQMEPTETLGSSCAVVASQMGLDSHDEHEWAAKHGYFKEESALTVAFYKRGCTFGDGSACFNYINTIRDPAEEARLRQLPQCQASDLCRSNGAIQMAEIRQREAEKKSNTLDVLNAVNGALGAVNDTLAQANAQQAAQNEARMQQAQAQVDANNARRAQQAVAATSTQTKTFSGPTANGAIRKETLVGNNSTGWTDTIQCFAAGATVPYESFSRSGPTEFIQNIPACQPPPSQPTTASSSPTAAPPVPYQKPPSTGGTVVATLCPASGFSGMRQTGDIAVGIPCTPGQPISGGNSSSSNGSSSSGSGHGTAGMTIADPLKQCITQSYDHDDLTFTNTCNVTVYTEWHIGPHFGSWNIDPGTYQHTGYTGADVAAGGGDTYYVCPKNYSPVDSSYRRITTSVSNYTCRQF